ncbi:MAG: hypothetical protein RBT37_01755 [Dissulfurispiraceae bacterium]|jgi:TusA-related sulfurtransferase|nr:hypothetical protein [Dissulfurispiraceae bacterium]
MAGRKKADIVLDLKGSAPALAVIKVRRPFILLEQDEVLEVITDIEGVYDEISKLCDLLDGKVLSSPGKRRVQRIRIKKK